MVIDNNINMVFLQLCIQKTVIIAGEVLQNKAYPFEQSRGVFIVPDVHGDLRSRFLSVVSSKGPPKLSRLLRQERETGI